MDTAAPSIPVTSPAELARRRAGPDAPLLLDVRPAPRFDRSPCMLAGAKRCAPDGIAALAATAAPCEVVVYCVYGHQVSAGAAAMLRAAGWQASLLSGGFEGGEDGVDAPADIAAWRPVVQGLRVPKPTQVGDADAAPSGRDGNAPPPAEAPACPPTPAGPSA